MIEVGDYVKVKEVTVTEHRKVTVEFEGYVNHIDNRVQGLYIYSEPNRGGSNFGVSVGYIEDNGTNVELATPPVEVYLDRVGEIFKNKEIGNRYLVIRDHKAVSIPGFFVTDLNENFSSKYYVPDGKVE
jgi:hypothetical protein